MKKYVAFLIIIIMVIMVGCHSKSISQNESTIGSVQTGSNTGENTADPDETSDSNTTETDNKNSEGTSSSSNQTNSTTTANNTEKGEDKKAQTSNTQTAVKPSVEKEKPETGWFTLFISKNRGTEEILRKKVQIEESKSLLDYLRDNVTVKDDGGFIKSIEGFEAITSMKLTTEQKNAGIMGVDWFLFQNEIKTKSGANDIVPKDGDTINLDYKEWTYQDLAP
ncbi:MAG: Uncharacterized protein K0R09_2736 [Clostridiales bacterium]|nr:Uncharacterized protein [Clostridiales bacterium]